MSAKKPDDLQRKLLQDHDKPDGAPAALNGKSLNALVRRGWMEKLPGQSAPGFVTQRRWRTTPAGREAAK